MGRTTRNTSTGVTYARQREDFYREPTWAVHALFNRERIHGTILDPFCGSGTIVRIARQRGHIADASDLIDRVTPNRFFAYQGMGPMCWPWPHLDGFAQRDFLMPVQIDQRATHDWCVTNPVFEAKTILQVAENALLTARVGVALLFTVGVLETSERARFWERAPLKCTYIFADRATMPPGDSGKEPDEEGGGTRQYVWLVFRHDWDDEPRTRWLYR